MEVEVPSYQLNFGILPSKKISAKLARGKKTPQLTDILKPAHFVPPTKKVDEMFDYFQAYNTRAAIVLGEYGEVLGIVTMKDVLKFIFGEITGRMRGQEFYREQDENCYTVPGDMRLTDFNNLTNFNIEDPVMTTIGGVAFRLFDRLPKVGEKVMHEGFEITVKKVSGLRISSVQVRKGISPEPKEEPNSTPEQVETEAEPVDEQAEVEPTEAEGTAGESQDATGLETSMADNREAGDR